jgi:hypothetical protein
MPTLAPMLLRAPPRPCSPKVQFTASLNTKIQVRTPQDMREWAGVLNAPDHLPPDAMLQRLYLLELADSRVTGYLARVDGCAVAACDLFSSEGLGRVDFGFV